LARGVCWSIGDAMRPLTDDETRMVFDKLYKFIGKNIRYLVDRPDEVYVMRLHRGRVFYVAEMIMKRAGNIGRDELYSLGQCIGKFTHSGRFRLTLGVLPLLAQYARYKVWVKPQAELSFLYGNHVLKSGLGRVTENTPDKQGVLVCSMSDVPLGFGVAAKSTHEMRKLDPTAIVAFHQADVGEYLRNEDDLTV